MRPVARATSRACSQTSGSSSGPEATMTRAPQADELGGVLGRERRVDRGEDPDRLGREQQRHQLGAVDRDDRDGVAALDPEVREHVRRPVDVGGELRERAVHRRLPALRVGEHRRRRAVGHSSAARVTSS